MVTPWTLSSQPQVVGRDWGLCLPRSIREPFSNIAALGRAPHPDGERCSNVRCYLPTLAGRGLLWNSG